jgi:hypothetical protein
LVRSSSQGSRHFPTSKVGLTMRGQLGAFVGEFVQIDVFRNVPKLKIKTCVRQSAECIAKHGSKSPGRPLQRPQQNQTVASCPIRCCYPISHSDSLGKILQVAVWT